MARTATVGNDITLGIKFYQNGNLFDPYSVDTVIVYDAQTGGNVVTAATPTRVSLGYYTITWSVPLSQTAGTFYDEWVWIAENGMDTNTQRYSLTLTEPSVTEDDQVIVDDLVAVYCRDKPTWEHKIGVRAIRDHGNGQSLRIDWGGAIPVNPSYQIHYNLYYSTTRFGVFSDQPKAITTDESVSLHALTPGQQYYFAIRATEFDPTVFDLTQLRQISTYLFEYPEEQTLINDMEDGYSDVVQVADNSGFAPTGFILVGDSEIMKYTIQDENEFVVTTINRGLSGTLAQAHSAGETVRQWSGFEDDNTNILIATPAWHSEWGVPHTDNESLWGEADNVDEDGYRAAIVDSITTDMSSSDDNLADFPAYDYCGYHRPSMEALLRGQCQNTYSGGQFNGGRGLFAQDRHFARLEMLLQTAGERIILFKRKWTGPRCRCISMRHESPRSRCQYCFGTGFEGGYDRYINTRPISEIEVNTQGFIMARIPPYKDDLNLVSDQGLTTPVELTGCWSLAIPTIKDRDLIIRFNEDGSEEFRYECLNVTRNKLFFGQSGKQSFDVRRLDKTDELYTLELEVL